MDLGDTWSEIYAMEYGVAYDALISVDEVRSRSLAIPTMDEAGRGLSNDWMVSIINGLTTSYSFGNLKREGDQLFSDIDHSKRLSSSPCRIWHVDLRVTS